MFGIIEKVVKVVPYKEDCVSGLEASCDSLSKQCAVMNVTDKEVGTI